MSEPAIIEIFVIEADHSPVTIRVDGSNGRVEQTLPIGSNVPLDARLLPALETSAGIKWRRVGEPLEAPTPSVEPDFDAESVIAGTVAEVEARLASLTPAQLLSVRDAETDREAPRKGVQAAINKLIAASNQE